MKPSTPDARWRALRRWLRIELLANDAAVIPDVLGSQELMNARNNQVHDTLQQMSKLSRRPASRGTRTTTTKSRTR